MKKIYIALCVVLSGCQIFAQQTDIDKIYNRQKELLNLEWQDNYYDTVYSLIAAEIKQSDGFAKAIWHSYMAGFLQDYYNANQYKIVSITPVNVPAESLPFDQWDIRTIVSRTVEHHSAALAYGEDLKNVSMESCKKLFTKTDSNTLIYCNNLYDVLAHLALDYYSNTIYKMPVPIQEFSINSSVYFADNSAFVAYVLPAVDTLSFQYLSLQTLQAMTKMYRQRGTRMQIYIQLLRLDYVYNHAVVKDADTLYLQALQQMEQNFYGQAGYANICLHLGQYYQTYDRVRAVYWYQQAIEQEPNTIEAQCAEFEMNEIKKPALTINAGRCYTADETDIMNIKCCNADSIYFRLIPCSADFYGQITKNYYRNKLKVFNTLLKKPAVKTWTIPAHNTQDYSEKRFIAYFPALPAGNYVLCSSLRPFEQKDTLLFDFMPVQTSNLQYGYRRNGQTVEVEVFNRKSGKPMKNVNVSFSQKNNVKTLLTDATGKVLFTFKSGRNDYDLKVYTNGDTLQRNVYLYSYNTSWREKINYGGAVFTDRAIYRPGQMLYFKTVSYAYDTAFQVLPNEKCMVELYNTNGELVSALHGISNEYGSFSGNFTIPDNGNTGSYYMRFSTEKDKNYYHDIRVEEYKRPSFYASIAVPEAAYKLNDSISMTGSCMAYAGYGIDHATVKYHITRRSGYFYRWWFRPMETKEIASGETQTDADGTFTIQFLAAGGKDYDYYEYVISADITDMSGETHSCNTSVRVGRTAMNICLDMPSKLQKTKQNIRLPLVCRNMSGQNQQAKVHYTIVALNIPPHFLHAADTNINVKAIDSADFVKQIPFLAYHKENYVNYWTVSKKMAEGDIRTNDSSVLVLAKTANWPDGYYKVILSSADTFQQTVQAEEYFILQSANNPFPEYSALSMKANENIVYLGDTIKIELSTYLENASVLLDVACNDKIVESKVLNLNKNVQTLYYIPTAKQMGNWKISAYVTQHNVTYHQEKTVVVQKENTDIQFKFISFRNSLLPGQKEQWSIQLCNAKGQPVQAELLCNMYDASLDAFAGNNFHMNTRLKYYHSYTLSYNIDRYFSFLSFSLPIQGTCYGINYPYWEMLPSSGYGRYYFKARGNIKRRSSLTLSAEAESAPVMCMGAAKNAAAEDMVLEDAMVDAEADEETEESATEASLTEVRTNFEETAFFLPHLRTNEEGIVNFSAVMPESLTKWKMQGIAHTQNGFTGYFEKTIVTQKPLMVVPNYPRFFRQGDTIAFTVKIVNLDSSAIAGKVNLELTDAETGLSANSMILKQDNAFKIEKGQSGVAVFTLAVPHDISLLTCRITAADHRFSDGEEKAVPVLTNRMLVTETMPVYVNGMQTKTFTFKKFQQACSNYSSANNTLQHYKFTFEYTPSPAWYAVQALPYLMEYPYECNEQIFSRLYANSIADKIVKSSPKIKEVFAAWLHQDSSALLSALEKNAELKTIALEETPWLTDAKNEKADKQKIATLFQTSKINASIQNAKRKLENAQRSDGGWSWFKGGNYSSPYITSLIISGTGHLMTMQIDAPLSKNCLQKAIAYLDGEMQKWYDDLKKENLLKSNNVSYIALQYIYARTYFISAYPIAPKYKAMYDYCIDQMQKYWGSQNLYGQALTALALYRNQDVATAKKIVASLQSKAQYSEETGMWWRKEGYGWNWYEAPIERQALMIEAFAVINHDSESVSKMQLWLLKQKQTQHWSSTRSTSDACYALLMRGDNLLDNTNNTLVSIGDDTFQTDTIVQAEKGTGYFKKYWNQKEIKSDMGTITLQKQGKGSSWGAAYWQYFENLDKITFSQTPLKLEKEIYKVTIGDRGEVLEPVTEKNAIHVGDKIRVRIVLHSDRDMQYLHLKDMRASALEPVNVLSGYKYQNGLVYYQSTRDASTNFFIEYLPKGTFVFEYTLVASQKGQFSNGITTIQCMYAPEFTSHSNGIRIRVE
ncbi:MAG: hypothetical protein J5701_00860 [Bacteroidales bacterium]|nr:hypothetical protein [Bacteroidales bacterium]